MEPQAYGMSRFAGFFEGGYAQLSITPLAIHANSCAALIPMNEDSNLPSAVVVPFGKLCSDLIRSGLYRVVMRYSGEGTLLFCLSFFQFPIWFPPSFVKG